MISRPLIPSMTAAIGRSLRFALAASLPLVPAAAKAKPPDSDDFPTVYQEPKDQDPPPAPQPPPAWKSAAELPSPPMPQPRLPDSSPPLVDIEKGNIILLHPFGDSGDPARDIQGSQKRPANSDQKAEPDSDAPSQGYYRYSIDCPISLKGVPPLNAPGCESFVHAIGAGEHLTEKAVQCIQATLPDPYKALFSTRCKMVRVEVCGLDPQPCSTIAR